MEVPEILNPMFIDNPGQEGQQILKSKDKYIRVIVYLTLQFIMGHYEQSESDNNMYQETQIVSATASEFMELVIRSISQVSPVYCTNGMVIKISRFVSLIDKFPVKLHEVITTSQHTRDVPRSSI